MAKILIAIASIVIFGAVAVLLNNLSTTIQRNSSVVNIVNATTNNKIETAAQQDAISSPETTEKEEESQEDAAGKTAEIGEVEQPISKLASAISDNIRPIGSADASAKSASSATRSGEEIFNGVCTACHTTGVLEAPKLGDKTAWELRMANGFDALLASAIKGKGNMPAKGGDASLSDDDVQATVIYMLEKAGIDTGITEASTTEESASEVSTTEESTTEESASEASTTEAPVTPETPETPTAPITPETPETPTAPDAVEPVTASDEKTADTVESTPVIADNSAEAKKLYKTVCFTCHDAGIAGAPIVGNTEQWAPRIAQGKDALYHTSLNGKGAMPPKGGNPSLDDDLVKATVDYMVDLSQ